LTEDIEDRTCGICGLVFRFSQHRKAHQKAEYKKLKKKGVKWILGRN